MFFNLWFCFVKCYVCLFLCCAFVFIVFVGDFGFVWVALLRLGYVCV